MTFKFNLIRAVVAVGLALSVTACSSNPSAPVASPAAPSASTASPAPIVTGGATVSGTVAVSSGPTGLIALPAAQGTATYGITVSVDGTSLSTTVDGAGRFKLSGVPSGTVQLKFSGGGMQGTITLTGVKDADDITVAVTLTPAGASLDTEQTDTGGTVELEGRISTLRPGGVADAVLVDTTTVRIPATADIRHGGTVLTFGDLQVGDRIHVKGTRNGQAITAAEVIVQNSNGNVPVNLNGDVTALLAGSSCPSIHFTLQGWTVDTDGSTSFDKGPCSGIATGTSVHVKGAVQPSGRVLATWVQTGK